MENIKNNSLMALAIPIFFELLLITIIGNIDTIMLTKFNEDAVAAVGGVSQILNIQNVLFGFITLATTILCAQYVGMKNKEKIQQVIVVSLVSNLIIGIFLGVIYAVFSTFILHLIKLPLTLIKISKTYFILVGGICVFQAITLTCGAILKSMGNTRPMLFVNIFVNLLNILGNGMFLFGWFGTPFLGVTGVGISTVVSRFIGSIIAFIIMSHQCKFKFQKKFLFLFPIEILKNIISIGIPTAGEYLAWSVGQLIISALVNKMGEAMIASRTFLLLLANLTMTFSISLGHATAIQVGHLVGADAPKKAYKKCLTSLKISFIASFVVTIFIFIFRYQIMEFFTKDLEILKISLAVFPWIIVLECGRVFNIVIINSLHAAGDIKFPMIVGILSVFLITVTFSQLLGVTLGFGLVGIWIANSLDEWIRGIIMLYRWKSKKWLNKKFS